MATAGSGIHMKSEYKASSWPADTLKLKNPEPEATSKPSTTEIKAALKLNVNWLTVAKLAAASNLCITAGKPAAAIKQIRQH